ncbi:MAG: FecR family protein [Ferruginibacter sp.]
MMKDRIWTLVSRKLSGEATASELTELMELIQTQANTDLYLQAIEEYWKIPPECDHEFLEATYHLHLNRLKQKGFDLETDKEKDESHSPYFNYTADPKEKHPKKRAVLLMAALSMFALLFVTLYIFKGSTAITSGEKQDKIVQSEVSTKSGSRTKIQLPDGSSVWLNGSSKLVYDNVHFGEKLREVTLTGEGYFDVVKNKDKPFIIHTNRINIKVIGTVFNIKAYPGEKNTETSLIRGSIEVTTKDGKEKIMMKPNDKLIIRNEEAVSEKAANKSIAPLKDAFISMSHLTLANDENTVVETAWVDNKLVFDKESFEEVALKMERWYGVSIRFSDNKLKLQKLTGTFEKETVIEALAALQLSTPFFQYKINNQTINIFK